MQGIAGVPILPSDLEVHGIELPRVIAMGGDGLLSHCGDEECWLIVVGLGGANGPN